MTTGAGRDARLVLLAVVSGGGGLIASALAGSATGFAILDPWLRPHTAEPTDTLAVFVISASLILLGALLLATHNFTRRVLRGQSDPIISPRPIGVGSALSLVLTWLASVVMVQILVDREWWTWSAPLLHLVGVAVPVYVLVRVSIGGLAPISRVRLWGSFTTGLVLGTGIAAAAEIAVLLLALTAGAAHLIRNPQQVGALVDLVGQLGHVSGMEEILALMRPLLAHPLTFLIALGAVSGFVPVIEELAKSAAVWTVYDRLSTPAQGFSAGALSGAAFALFEGLMASVETTSSSGFVLLIRGASSLMHIVASGMAGWGIAAFRQSGQPARLLGAYALAIGLHGVWNASVVTIVYGGVRASYGGSETDWLAGIMAGSGGLALLGLMALLPIALVTLNRRLRAGADLVRMEPIPSRANSARDSGHED